MSLGATFSELDIQNFVHRIVELTGFRGDEEDGDCREFFNSSPSNSDNNVLNENEWSLELLATPDNNIDYVKLNDKIDVPIHPHEPLNVNNQTNCNDKKRGETVAISDEGSNDDGNASANFATHIYFTFYSIFVFINVIHLLKAFMVKMPSCGSLCNQ